MKRAPCRRSARSPWIVSTFGPLLAGLPKVRGNSGWMVIQGFVPGMCAMVHTFNFWFVNTWLSTNCMVARPLPQRQMSDMRDPGMNGCQFYHPTSPQNPTSPQTYSPPPPPPTHPPSPTFSHLPPPPPPPPPPHLLPPTPEARSPGRTWTTAAWSSGRWRRAASPGKRPWTSASASWENVHSSHQRSSLWLSVSPDCRSLFWFLVLHDSHLRFQCDSCEILFFFTTCFHLGTPLGLERVCYPYIFLTLTTLPSWHPNMFLSEGLCGGVGPNQQRGFERALVWLGQPDFPYVDLRCHSPTDKHGTPKSTICGGHSFRETPFLGRILFVWGRKPDNPCGGTRKSKPKE